MKRQIKISKLALNKQTIAVLDTDQLSQIGGGCTDDSSGNGLLCPVFYKATRKTIVK